MEDYKHLSVKELKAHIKKYKHIHCKPYSGLKKEGLLALAKEIEAHEGKPILPKEKIEKDEEKKERKPATEKQIEHRRKFGEYMKVKKTVNMSFKDWLAQPKSKPKRKFKIIEEKN
jgi:DNA-binding protein H-NS